MDYRPWQSTCWPTDAIPWGAVAQWHREALRTNLWLLPTIEVIAAIGLFMVTLRLDRAVYNGRLRPPSWVISGTADAARQILASIAASVITVVGIVFSITIVTLTLASTQFGPRMLRNFIRDRGTQLTLGTTFVYCVVALVAIRPGPQANSSLTSPLRPRSGWSCLISRCSSTSFTTSPRRSSCRK